MSEFNFKSQICTDKIQSERLLSLGLKKETADMYITNMSQKGLNYTDDLQIGSISYCDVMSFCDSKGLQLEKTAWSIIPAWSLHRLIEIALCDVEMNIFISRRCFWINKPHLSLTRSDLKGGVFDGMIDYIEWLIKEGYFNKEYLCEK